jgi:ABC-type sugar transport system substrate-binding protein
LADKLRFVVALLDEAQEFQRHQAADARAVAAQLDADVEIVFAENNAIFQIQQLYRMIRTKPHAILVESVAGEGLERVARAAASAGVGWVLVNRKVPYIEALRREFPKLPIGTISTDQLEIGRIQGRQFRSLLPNGGRVLYVGGPPDTSAAQQRLQGAQEAVAGSKVELTVVEGQWTEASGATAVERWLRLKRELDVVGCQNDMMAVGAGHALAAGSSAADAKWIPRTGVDGLPDGGQKLVRMGQLAATVIVPSNTGPGLRALAQAFRGGAPVPAETLLLPVSFPDVRELAKPGARPERVSADR